MSRFRTVVALALGYLLILFVVPPRVALAYLDPGAGSYLIQILVAGLLALGLTVRVFWRSISGFFRRTFSRRREPPERTADER